MSVVTHTAETPKKPRGPARKRKPDFVSLDGLFTLEEWAAMPDTKPRYELIDGRLVQKMTTTRKHSKAAGQLLIACGMWGATSGWQFFPEGTGLAINPYKGYVPDVAGFTPETVLDPEANYDGPPFLVAEVLSPGTSKKDRTTKLRDYGRVGVQLYLIIDPDARTIEIHRLQNGAYGRPEVLQDNDVWQPAELPGLRVELARLWF